MNDNVVMSQNKNNKKEHFKAKQNKINYQTKPKKKKKANITKPHQSKTK